MLSPFLSDGWRVEFLEVTREWEILAHRPDYDAHRVAVVSLPFFGVPESARWLAYLQRLAATGAVIVSDETHRVLGPGLSLAHYRIGSLRKMLPVPDGAYLVGRIREARMAPPEIASVRLEGMARKTAFLSGSGAGGHQGAFALAESMTDTRATPAAMSDQAQQLIGRLDYARMAGRRRANGRVLEAGLRGTGYRATTLRPGVTPSHCVITGPDVSALRVHLTSRRIYCPIHWPAPSAKVRPRSPWPSRYLSLPLDQRYSTADMGRVADEIRYFSASRHGRSAQC